MKISRRALILAGLSVLATGCVRTSRSSSDGDIRSLPPGTRLVIVRHFDRDDENLNADGRARAMALPGVIADIPLDAIFTRHVQRNQDSTRPLAEQRGLEMQLFSHPVGVWNEVITQAAGRSVIWVGNSNNIVPMWDTLGLPGEPPVTYGELVVVEPGLNGRNRVTDRRIVPIGS